jgi:hypothetical protein
VSSSYPVGILDRITIRFDGRDAEGHQLDMAQLSEALDGLSKIIATCGHFAVTQRYVQHRDAMDVRVLVEEPERGCFSIAAVLEFVEKSPLLSGAIAGLAPPLVCWIFAQLGGKKEEMRHLRAITEQVLRQAGTRDERMLDRLLTTVEKMAASLQPAARQAVVPIGASASTLTVGDGTTETTIGLAEASIIRSEAPQEVGPEGEYHVLITELDMETGSCRIEFEETYGRRYKGQITDPAYQLPENQYVRAMAAKTWLIVRAKPTLKGGELDKLFISDSQVSPAQP